MTGADGCPTAGDYANATAQDAARDVERIKRVVLLIAEQVGCGDEAREILDPPSRLLATPDVFASLKASLAAFMEEA